MKDEDVLRFVYTHPGTWRRAFMGYAYHFHAPEFSRSPFQARRLDRLVREGRVERAGEERGESEGYLRVPELMPSRRKRRQA